MPMAISIKPMPLVRSFITKDYNTPDTALFPSCRGVVSWCSALIRSGKTAFLKIIQFEAEIFIETGVLASIRFVVFVLVLSLQARFVL